MSFWIWLAVTLVNLRWYASGSTVIIVLKEDLHRAQAAAIDETAMGVLSEDGAACDVNITKMTSLDVEVLSSEVTGCTPERICQQLLRHGEVEACEANEKMTMHGNPNDAKYGEQWGLHRIEAAGAWDLHAGNGGNVIVAVIDSGAKLDHEDLKPILWRNPGEIPGNGIDDDHNGWTDDVHGIDPLMNDPVPDDEIGHGTHCAGIIGAAGNNRVGISGVAQGVKVMPIKFFGTSGNSGDTNLAIQGIDYAIYMGARVISMSYGGYGAGRTMPFVISRAIQRHGVSFVASAGNDANNNDARPSYPCGYKGVICVAASWQTETDASKGLADFSNYGTSVEVAAPGTRILSTWHKEQDYAFLQGTSMAGPFVAGLAALIRDFKPDLAWQDVQNAIIYTADVKPAFIGKVECGRINAKKAMQAVVSGAIPTTCGSVMQPTPAPTRQGGSHRRRGGGIVDGAQSFQRASLVLITLCVHFWYFVQ